MSPTLARVKSKSCKRSGFEPTTLQRNAVRAMAAWGQPHKEIATLLDISLAKLRQHFRDELQSEAIETQATATMKLFALAMTGNVGAMTSWLKTRAGWKDDSSIQPQADGKPLASAFAKANKSLRKARPIVRKSKGRGRPRFRPSRAQRMLVTALAARDAGREYIARKIRISQPTRRARFANELCIGAAKAQAAVGWKLYQSGLEGNFAAVTFWLKCQAGWRENEIGI